MRRILLGWLEFTRQQFRLLLVIPHPNKFLPFRSIFQECGEKNTFRKKKHIHVTTISIYTRHKKKQHKKTPPPVEATTTTTTRLSTKTNNGVLHWGGDDAHGRYYRIVAFIVLLMVTWLGLFLALSLLYPWQDVLWPGDFASAALHEAALGRDHFLPIDLGGNPSFNVLNFTGPCG